MAKEHRKETVRMALYEKVPIEGHPNSFKSETVGSEDVECLVEIDLREITYLCQRAARNKTKRARQGAVEARVLNRTLAFGRYPQKRGKN